MLKPLRGFILVEVIDDTGTTASGLIMPETAKDKPQKGIVIEVGEPIIYFSAGIFEGKITPQEHAQVKKGDKVIFKKWSSTDIEEDGKKLAFVEFKDCLGVYEN